MLKNWFAQAIRRTSSRRPFLRVEVLESRLAPATLISPTTLTYRDVDGNNVTVHLSKPLLTSATIAADVSSSTPQASTRAIRWGNSCN